MKQKCKVMSIVLIIIIVALLIYKFIYPTYMDVYSLKGDYIPSIKTVLDKTKFVSNYTVSTKNNVLYKTFEYKHQDNVIEDIKKYTNYLIQMEQFEVLKSYDLNDYNNTSVYLGKTSHVNSEYILLVDIEYTASSYKIHVSKKKGTLLK
jgi:hypothetical protein